jgi:DNA-binding Xre family transcriptional regulator
MTMRIDNHCITYVLVLYAAYRYHLLKKREYMTVRLKVKEVAARQGVSQRQLSIRTGITIKNIQRIFRNPYSNVTTETLDKLATVLDVDASELIESVEEC